MNYYIHNLDPIALSFGPIVIPWYWLTYFWGYFCVYYSLEYFRKEGLSSLSSKEIYISMIGGFISLLLGGRIGYVLIYNLSYFLNNPSKVFAIWEGGMSFHGALISVSIFLLYISRKFKKSIFEISDPIATTVPLVLAFGRLSNFINGELAGRVSDVPWAMIFPKFYDQSPRHPSQLYQAMLEGFLLFFILWSRRKNLKNRGEQSAVFLIGYGVFRFSTEFFRKPDSQLGLYLDFFTMGQILCLMMVSVGFYILINSSRKP